MRLIKTCALMSMLVVASGCGTSLPAFDYAKLPDPRVRGFVLGPSDRIEINVWKNQELSTSSVVRPDGTVTMPLLGDLQASGKKPDELRDIITKRLENYIKTATPTVTISVVEVNSYYFTVQGNVSRPGLFRERRFVTVQEAIAVAGGPTRFADLEACIVRRRLSDGKELRIPINYKMLLKASHPEQNIVLLPGDVVSIP